MQSRPAPALPFPPSCGSVTSSSGSTGGDAANCIAGCANVESCAPESYAAVDDYSTEEECITFCENQYAAFDANSCGDEFIALQVCLTAAACNDLVAFLENPLTAGICGSEATAAGACAPGG